MKEMTVKEHLEEELKDPEFRALYEKERWKFDIVKEIITYRIRHKLTQGQLAKRIGVSQQHISKIEDGVFSSLSTLEKLLTAMGMRVQVSFIKIKPQIRKRISQAIVRSN